MFSKNYLYIGVPRSSLYHNTNSTWSLGSEDEISHGRYTGSPATASTFIIATATDVSVWNEYKTNQLFLLLNT